MVLLFVFLRVIQFGSLPPHLADLIVLSAQFQIRHLFFPTDAEHLCKVLT